MPRRFGLQYTLEPSYVLDPRWFDLPRGDCASHLVALPLPHGLVLACAGPDCGWVVGLAPGTPLLETTAGTFLYGFVFVLTAVWGIGGLLPFRSRRQRLA